MQSPITQSRHTWYQTLTGAMIQTKLWMCYAIQSNLEIGCFRRRMHHPSGIAANKQKSVKDRNTHYVTFRANLLVFSRLRRSQNENPHRATRSMLRCLLWILTVMSIVKPGKNNE